jgi:hypothetical protein
MFLAAASAAAVSRRLAAAAQPVLRPEDFGAQGDGVHNDSDALTALSRTIERAGGGTIALASKRTYIVGQQRTGGERAFIPQPLLAFSGLTRPLTILGNGARIRAAHGLRFGSFDRHSGRPVNRPLPNLDESLLSSPYWGMIFVRGARAPVEIRDLELDGNTSGLSVGGQYGDTGWQVPGSGLYFSDNAAEELVENVFSHDHPLDGATISGDPNRTARSRFVRLVCRSNARQGLSLVGGRAYDFEDCEFSHTGRGRIASSPGAGVDIEAEDKIVRDLRFVRCRFVDNIGAGMIADSGDSADARFSDCMFVGTTSWSAWPNKPGFSFLRCTFAGSCVHPYASRDAAKAAEFVECRFTDDPSLSPGGKLYFGGGPGGAVVNADPSDNVRFVRCRFELRHGGVLPWSWHANYQECVMKQASRTPAMTKGKYLGRNVIDGPVDLYGSMVVGSLTLNGRSVPKGPVGSDFRPW